jgi:hypothetical protein
MLSTVFLIGQYRNPGTPFPSVNERALRSPCIEFFEGILIDHGLAVQWNPL